VAGRAETHKKNEKNPAHCKMKKGRRPEDRANPTKEGEERLIKVGNKSSRTKNH